MALPSWLERPLRIVVLLVYCTASELLARHRNLIDAESQKVIAHVLFELGMKHDWPAPNRSTLPKMQPPVGNEQ